MPFGQSSSLSSIFLCFSSSMIARLPGPPGCLRPVGLDAHRIRHVVLYGSAHFITSQRPHPQDSEVTSRMGLGTEGHPLSLAPGGT